ASSSCDSARPNRKPASNCPNSPPPLTFPFIPPDTVLLLAASTTRSACDDRGPCSQQRSGQEHGADAAQRVSGRPLPWLADALGPARSPRTSQGFGVLPPDRGI